MTEENKLLNLIDLANYYTKNYDLGHPIISDKEWDKIYFEIQELEEKLNIYYKHSPTQHIPYDIVNELKKVEHNHKMLSLQKTKNLNEVEKFLNNFDSLIMLKMDGLTCSLTYVDGELVSAETRGNGIIGEDILHNALQIPSIPNYIPKVSGKLVIDGEIICTIKNFEIFASEYKNPRNFAAGSIRLLDSQECAKRKLTFIAWDVIEGLEEYNLLSERLAHIGNYGFNVVPYEFYPSWDADNNQVSLDIIIDHLKFTANEYGYPIDGIVAKFNSISYGKSLGETTHHFKNALAYKFYDETYWTRLLNIEWTMGRTGVLTPVAIFEPIDIDGSTVERASLHNCSIMSELFGPLGPHKYQEIEVFKANMIIPQIKSVKQTGLYEKNAIHDPTTCSMCGGEVAHKIIVDSMTLVCTNPACPGKLINRLDHFCGKKGLDMKGISKATLEKLIDWGWVADFTDIFKLSSHKDEWIQKPGFGIKSVEKVLNAINTGANCELHQFIAALGIPLIGSTASKELAKHFETWEKFIQAVEGGFAFDTLPNFGSEMHNSIVEFNYAEARLLADKYIHFNVPEVSKSAPNGSDLTGKIFVITGRLQLVQNREKLINIVESYGGKVSSNISNHTNYLINNNINSTSAKNKKAKELNIPIITEQDFFNLIGVDNIERFK